MSSHETLDLYQHTLQPDWGLATQVTVRGPHALYQFEDGKVREFRAKTPLLRRVRSSQRHAHAVDLLHRHLDARDNVRRQQRARRRVARTPPTLTAQIKAFKEAFPLGFQGLRWKVQMRGHGSGPRLKRHREPAVLGARQRLASAVLTQLVHRELYDEVHRLAMETLSNTDLVHASQRRPLERMSASERRRFALRITEFLHAHDELFDARFDRWVQACDVYLKRPPAWESVTAPLALLRPDEHICVRQETLTIQSERLGMALSLPQHPTAEAYQEALGVVRGVRDACNEAGLSPDDLLDVCDFIELTCGRASS